MKRRSLGEVCKLLNIRPHVIRYWEQMIPLFEPEKNLGGRRTYGEREIHLLYRLKYLVQERRYTLEGAFRALVEEGQGKKANVKAAIQALRSELLEMQEILEHSLELLHSFQGWPVIPGQEHLEKILKRLPWEAQKELYRDMKRFSPTLLELTQFLLENFREEEPLRLIRKKRSKPRKPEESLPSYFNQVLGEGRMGVITLLSSMNPADIPLSLLEKLANRICEIMHLYGRTLLWCIFGDSAQIQYLRDYVKKKSYFSLEPKALYFLKEPVFPALVAGKVVIQEEGRLSFYSSGQGGALLLMQSQSLQHLFQRYAIEWFYFLPLNSFSLKFPDGELLQHIVETGVPMAGTAMSSEEGYRTTGIYVMQNAFLLDRKRRIPFTTKKDRLRIINPEGSSTDDILEVDVNRLCSSPAMLLGEIPHAWFLAE
ncbi:MAG TPA: MerR family transcriptional regulator [Spirochaetales bacterium]|nr:MerR family transcriptional regulator [Spirochaetales bacterium]